MLQSVNFQEVKAINQKQQSVKLRRSLHLVFKLLAVLVAGFVPAYLFAQAKSPVIQINEAAARAEITVQPLRGNISVLMGSGGNITVLTGPEGKLLIDAGIAVSRPRLQAALDGITKAPIKVLNQYPLALGPYRW
ncbi:MAG TPA: hypothetical protein VLB68_03110 [Pyrinomonadaceae bacterium]|nr:hypothetical protein [Pyrinomonadaceae bacterium]